jgi:hypothetical protein
MARRCLWGEKAGSLRRGHVGGGGVRFFAPDAGESGLNLFLEAGDQFAVGGDQRLLGFALGEDDLIVTLGSRRMLAGALPSAKKRQPADLRSLLILMRAVASLSDTRIPVSLRVVKRYLASIMWDISGRTGIAQPKKHACLSSATRARKASSVSTSGTGG